MAKSWVERYIEWGRTRAENQWTPSTATAYRRELVRLERYAGKAAEELDAEDLRTYFARHVSPKTWNSRYHAINGFFEFVAAQGFFDTLNAQGLHRVDPSWVLTRRRREPRTPRPAVDVLATIAQITDETDRQLALFLYHSGLKLGEACSIAEPPVDGKLHVQRRGGKWEWVAVSDRALDLLRQLGGKMPPGRKARNIERRLPVKPSQIEAAAKRDHQLRTSHGDALGPVWALLVGRSDLLKVARAYRDAVEEMEDPNGRPNASITAAARALQAMLTALGAQGNRLGPLFDSARAKGYFGPYDSKLTDAMQSLVDWVSADRSGRGDAHQDTSPSREDAWLALRVVAALLLRLEASMA